LTTATVDAGTALAAGDVFARAGGDEGFALRTPVAGVVGEGDELWLAPTSWEDDAEAISWGAAGRRFYAAQLADSKNDLDPFATLRTRWIHAHAKIRSADDVLQALRRERDRPRFASRRELDALLVDRLRIALQDDRVKQALTRLDRSVAFRLHDPEADVVLTHDGVTTKPPTEDDLILHASAETADDYFAGRIDLPAALRRRDNQSSAAPGAVLRAASVLKPLHARY
jgi:hypothetical protein